MSKNADGIVVGANGTIYAAGVGSAIPATVADPLGPAWVDLGYVTEDGVTWTDGKTVEPIRAWQSFYDLRRIITAREGSLGFGLMEWKGTNVQLAFGGGEITSPEEGLYEYQPPAPEFIDERALAVEWQDGAKNYRLLCLKGTVSDNVETNIVRTAAAVLPITFGFLGQDGLPTFRFQTDDEAFADALGSGS